MSIVTYEYKVVPAPRRGEKARTARTTEDRFSLALQTTMNTFGAEGWEYLRAETLPCDERAGLTGTKTSFLNVLVFRRAIPGDDEADEPGSHAPLILGRNAPDRGPRLGAADDAPSGAAPALGPAVTNDYLR